MCEEAMAGSKCSDGLLQFTDVQKGWADEWFASESGWGNNELEIYTQNNVLVNSGKLSITATFDGTNFQSGRLRTYGKRNFQPSVDTPNGIRIEASIQLPAGVFLVP